MSTVSDHDPDPAGSAVATDDPALTTEPAGDVADAADLSEPSPSRPAGARRGTGLFRAFWRWHFYASALVIPVLLMLAVTGLIYLFRWQIDPIMHPGVLTVSVPAHVTEPAVLT